MTHLGCLRFGLLALLLGPGCAASAADGAGSELGVDGGGEPRCPAGVSGARMVLIRAGEQAFCMDVREARQGEYLDFMRSVTASASTQSAECSWNDSFFPPDLTPAPLGNSSCVESLFDPASYPESSVGCVDWCDARAFCEWAGKRLCGGLGGAQLSYEQDLDPALSEWSYACTAGGTLAFPYGSEYEAGVCMDDAVQLPQGGLPLGTETCRGAAAPYDAIYDLVGSVREWTAAAVSASEAPLYGASRAVRGGSFSTSQPSCAEGGHTDLHQRMPGVGIRCCADAT